MFSFHSCSRSTCSLCIFDLIQTNECMLWSECISATVKESYCLLINAYWHAVKFVRRYCGCNVAARFRYFLTFLWLSVEYIRNFHTYVFVSSQGLRIYDSLGDYMLSTARFLLSFWTKLPCTEALFITVARACLSPPHVDDSRRALLSRSADRLAEKCTTRW